MDPDGSNNKRISVYPRWLYPDGYTCLYHDPNVTSHYKIYRSNLDHTFDEFIFDCKTVGKNNVHYSDFNPKTSDLLIVADPIITETTLLLKYNIDSKIMDTVSINDSGWLFVLEPVFSHDAMKIAAVEANYTALLRRISILENGTKVEVAEIPMRDEYGNAVSIDWTPLAFSGDDKYLSFSKNVWHGGSAYTSYHYVVELATKKMTLIDEGSNFQWNPKKLH